MIAGPSDDGSDFALFAWTTGSPTARQLQSVDMHGLRPEAAVWFGASLDGEVLILSDDGGREMNGERCKDLEKSRQSFRGAWVKLP